MNKYIIFALLFVFVINEDIEDYYYTGADREKCTDIIDDKASVDSCSAIKFDDDDYNCCFVSLEVEGEKDKYCQGVKKSKVKKIIDAVEDNDEVDISLSIDCSSDYISNALIILLSLLF